MSDLREDISLQLIIEKAEKWDKLFKGLHVVKKCWNRTCEEDGIWEDCPNCNGTGKIYMPLTEEEKKEIGEWMLYAIEQHHKGLITHPFKNTILKSGVRVEVLN